MSEKLTNKIVIMGGDDNKQRTVVKTWLHFAAGGIGGTVGAVLTCPLEVVKTRLQSSIYKNRSGTGLVQMLRDIHTKEGIRGLWRGLGPNLVGVVPARAIYFSTYASTKEHLIKRLSTDGSESPAIHLLSAVAAGIATSTCTNPIWLIKTRMQLQSEELAAAQKQGSVSRSDVRSTPASTNVNSGPVKKMSATASMSTAANLSSESQMYYKNSFDCLRKVVKQEGALALFRGLSASYFGIIEGTIQWITYEQLKRISKQQRQKISTTEGADIGSSAVGKKAPRFNISDTFMAAGAAKFIATISTYPHEVIRTRLRQAETVRTLVNDKLIVTNKPKYDGIRHIIRTVWKEEGLLAFYGGMTAHILRTVPNAAIMFLCYESLVYFADDE